MAEFRALVKSLRAMGGGSEPPNPAASPPGPQASCPPSHANNAAPGVTIGSVFRKRLPDVDGAGEIQVSQLVEALDELGIASDTPRAQEALAAFEGEAGVQIGQFRALVKSLR